VTAEGFALGVDLGTSHTVAVLRWPDGRTRPLLFDGVPLLPSAVYLDPNGALHGQAALGEWIASILRAFGDVEFQVVGQPLIALDRSRLMFEWVGTSRMTGALDPPGFAPTGRRMRVQGVDLWRMRDGRIEAPPQPARSAAPTS